MFLKYKLNATDLRCHMEAADLFFIKSNSIGRYNPYLKIPGARSKKPHIDSAGFNGIVIIQLDKIFSCPLHSPEIRCPLRSCLIIIYGIQIWCDILE